MSYLKTNDEEGDDEMSYAEEFDYRAGESFGKMFIIGDSPFWLDHDGARDSAQIMLHFVL